MVMGNEVPMNRGGARSRLTRGNGVTTDFVYDNASRLTEIVHRKPDGTLLSSFAYTFDPAGNITEIRFANGDVAQYDYDAKDQLTAEHRRGTLNYDITFTYDPVGNRLKQVRSGDLKDPWEITYSYNAGDELLRESNRQETTFYGYDPNGNTTSKTVYRTADMTKPKPNPQSQVTYGWDFENRMKDFGVKGRSRDSVYTYYADTWKRTVKQVHNNIERYLYDFDEILVDYNKPVNQTALYINGPIIDERLAMLRDGQLYYYLTDHLGSVREMVDIYGSISYQHAYEAFGASPDCSCDETARFSFEGRDWDWGNRLYYCRSRMYSPVSGRFMSAQRALGILEEPTYAFADNRPTSLKDPFGTFATQAVSTHITLQLFESGEAPTPEGVPEPFRARTSRLRGFPACPMPSGILSDPGDNRLGLIWCRQTAVRYAVWKLVEKITVTGDNPGRCKYGREYYERANYAGVGALVGFLGVGGAVFVSCKNPLYAALAGAGGAVVGGAFGSMIEMPGWRDDLDPGNTYIGGDSILMFDAPGIPIGSGAPAYHHDRRFWVEDSKGCCRAYYYYHVDIDLPNIGEVTGRVAVPARH